MTPAEIIARKRDGLELSAEEIHDFIRRFMRKEIKDYQMAALLMAIFIRGMNYRETTELTRAYIESGERLDLSDIPGVKVDKHSTGGVGDKVSIVLAPLVASLGVCVPMISGRGLGHTGGTLDKLESIPGFKVNLPVRTFRKLLAEHGVAMIGQTRNIVPADKRIYALRDVTATVESIPLITASIMSKKIAEGIDALVLDVKFGKGAFMQEPEKSEALARNLIRVGNEFGIAVHATLTSMEQPLGLKVGNWLEVEECLDCLHGRGPEDLMQVILTLSAQMVVQGQKAKSREEALAMCQESLENGDAFQKFLDMCLAQGANIRYLEEPQKYPKAKYEKVVVATRSGYLNFKDTRQVGMTAVELGAGRLRAEDAVDPTAGIILFHKAGDRVEQGNPLYQLFTNRESAIEAAVKRMEAAIEILHQPPQLPPLILKEISSQDVAMENDE